MLQEKNIDRATGTSYATASDFCRIFAEDMNRLYLLAFLLTADEEKAERCFAGALEDCSKSGGIFREWAHSWARRAVIQTAMRLSVAELERQRGGSGANFQPGAQVPEPLSAILRLGTFERFVYVMSVLERYTDQDCAVLLRCRRQQVVDSRLRALHHLASSGEQRFARPGFRLARLVAEPA